MSEGSRFSTGLWLAESRIAQPMMNVGRGYKLLFIQKRC